MKNFKIYLKNQGAGGAAKKVPFADTLNLLLLSWENRSKDNSGGGNSKRKKKQRKSVVRKKYFRVLSYDLVRMLFITSCTTLKFENIFCTHYIYNLE